MKNKRFFFDIDDGKTSVFSYSPDLSKPWYDTKSGEAVDESKPKKTCRYRGKQIGAKTCELCGNKGKQEPIYECSKHGKCCQSQYKKRRSQQEEMICVGCPDGPWSA